MTSSFFSFLSRINQLIVHSVQKGEHLISHLWGCQILSCSPRDLIYAVSVIIWNSNLSYQWVPLSPVLIDKSCSTRDRFGPQGTFGNVWRHFWLSQPGCVCVEGWWWCATGLQREGTRDVAKHSTTHRTAPTILWITKNYPAPNVSSDEAEKSWFRWEPLTEKGKWSEWSENLCGQDPDGEDDWSGEKIHQKQLCWEGFGIRMKTRILKITLFISKCNLPIFN